jgi:mRNA interferase MazF
MTFERWDIVTALFPFGDLEVRRPRPVLVLSTADFNGDHGHVIGAMITTAARSHWPTDHRISDLSSAGLRRDCVVRWKLFTLPLATIARRIGGLGMIDRAPAAARLFTILGA